MLDFANINPAKAIVDYETADAEPGISPEIMAILQPSDPEERRKVEERIEAGAIEEKLKEERRAAMSGNVGDKTYPFSTIEPPCPEEDDPNILFRNNWLAKGQSATLVSTTGVGKSSLAIQCALNWSLGRVFLAEPMRPLKICIIQAEDSERDLQEQAAGMRRGLAEIDGWTPEEIEEAESRLYYSEDFLGLCGEAFLAKLRDFQQRWKFDLIIINPIQAYFGGDVSDQESVTQFVRAGLDPILKDPEAGCCVLVVMHTAKQQSGKKDQQAKVDDYAEYMMSGSHEWADWSRAVLAFLRAGKADSGLYELRAAKRGRRLRWTDEGGEPTTKRLMKHSDGFIYWQFAGADEDPMLVEAKEKTHERAERLAEFLRERAGYQRGIIAMKHPIFTRRYILETWNFIKLNCEDFGLSYRAIGRKQREYIGTEEALNNIEAEYYRNGDYED